MQHSHLSAESWQTVAKFCVQTHELGTVYNVTEDLSSLQCVCKSSSACAASLWSSVAELCHKQSKKLGMKAFDLDVVKGYLTKQGVMTKSLKLANAGNLAPEMFTVYIQVQMDTVVSIKSSDAKTLYHLSGADLQTCVGHSTAPMHNRNAKQRKSSSSKKHKRSKDGVLDQCFYYKQVWRGVP